MSRFALSACLLGLLASSGCCTYNPCNPCGGPMSPWDTPYVGCVETGPLGRPRISACERRQLRRAMRCACGHAACPTCNGMVGGLAPEFSGGVMGMPGAMVPGAMVPGGSCPTCQQQMPMGMQYVDPGVPQMMTTPVQPEPDLSIPTPEPVPNPTPSTSNSVNPTSGEYYYPPPTATHIPAMQIPATFPSAQTTQSPQLLYAP